MPTDNRRVATYLPKEIDDRLKTFITERNLKGESQALITILSEFFGVSYPVARQVDYSAFVTQEQFKELLDRVSGLSEAFEKSKTSSAVNLLLGKMQRLENRMESLESPEEPRREIKPETLPGQLDLLTDAESDLFSKSESEPPKAKQGRSRFDVLRELVNKPAEEPQIAEDIDSLSGSSSELQQAENTTSTLEPLTGRALAARFGLYKDSVAGSKRSRTEEQFIQWTKGIDPSGIAWQYNLKDKLYHPLIEGASSQVNPLPEGS